MTEFFESDSFGRNRKFKVLDHFPMGYVVWNIGRQNFMRPGYIPIVKPDPNLEDHILEETISAVYLGEPIATKVMEAAGKRQIDFSNINECYG